MKNKIRKLNDKEIKDYQLLGRATGINFNYCVYLGHKYKKDFMKRVVGYRPVEDDKIAQVAQEKLNKKYISVEFYEKK